MVNPKNLPYQVKVITPDGKVLYGIPDSFGDESKVLFKDDKVIVDDAITPERYIVPVDRLIPVESNEYYAYLDQEHKKATAISNSEDGLHVGSLLSFGVGDGSAWYVVTKVNKKTVVLEWRGFCPDRWTYALLGYGGKFDRSMIEPFVRKFGAFRKIEMVGS